MVFWKCMKKRDISEVEYSKMDLKTVCGGGVKVKIIDGYFCSFQRHATR